MAGVVRAVDGDYVHPREHLIEAIPISRLQRIGHGAGDRFSVVIVHLHAERLGALGHGLTDPAHADDAQPLAAQPAPHHPGGRPAGETARLHHVGAFHDPARGGKDQRHGHVGGVFGEHARGVGDNDALGVGGGHIDVIHPCAEIGDQFELGTGGGDDVRVDLVGDGGGQYVRARHSVHQLGRRHGPVFQIQLGVEQLPHPGFHRIGEFAGDHDFWFLNGH